MVWWCCLYQRDVVCTKGCTAHLAWTFDPGGRIWRGRLIRECANFCTKKIVFTKTLVCHEKDFFHEKSRKMDSHEQMFFHEKNVLAQKKNSTKKILKPTFAKYLKNVWKNPWKNWWKLVKILKIVQDFAKNWQKRCPRNPVFGARDPGRKTKFPKGFPRKKTPIFKILPCGAKKWACGASVKGIVFYTKGARADAPIKGRFLADFLPGRAKKSFFLKFKK